MLPPLKFCRLLVLPLIGWCLTPLPAPSTQPPATTLVESVIIEPAPGRGLHGSGSLQLPRREGSLAQRLDSMGNVLCELVLEGDGAAKEIRGEGEGFRARLEATRSQQEGLAIRELTVAEQTPDGRNVWLQLGLPDDALSGPVPHMVRLANSSENCGGHELILRIQAEDTETSTTIPSTAAKLELHILRVSPGGAGGVWSALAAERVLSQDTVADFLQLSAINAINLKTFTCPLLEGPIHLQARWREPGDLSPNSTLAQELEVRLTPNGRGDGLDYSVRMKDSFRCPVSQSAQRAEVEWAGEWRPTPIFLAQYRRPAEVVWLPPEGVRSSDGYILLLRAREW
jgi:hypothetical protein